MITDPQRELLETYLDEAYRWNVRINLTTVPRGAAWDRHVLESVRLLEAVAFPAHGTVVDVGSGMGVPGLPLAVMRPDLLITLLEGDSRKAGFLIHAAGLLGLANLRVLATRAELAGKSAANRESFDVAVSRAAAPIAVLCEMALPLVRVGGWLVALATEASQECEEAARMCGGGAPAMAGGGAILIPKLAATPMAYPRPGLRRRRAPA